MRCGAAVRPDPRVFCGSPEAAWDEFMAEHAKVWMPQFAEACEKDSRVPFYKQAASLLGAFIK